MSKAYNKENFAQAKAAIEAVRGDMSVPWRVVYQQLEELADMCEGTLESMREEHKKELLR